ncbi:uncharacterized protein LOC122010557 [Zingiber officinale]|uniref:uncharacterized protein LOC122010555 n=1 Tax=Zingiber officinale TaxID=94328 RepID=UPI001C4AABE6|nr:uncharacterized protein LOC122010555 [Zingiber officinale]XP_042423012.1 uncharacterized protein LOC122010557 [Zingiber officinale]
MTPKPNSSAKSLKPPTTPSSPKLLRRKSNSLSAKTLPLCRNLPRSASALCIHAPPSSLSYSAFLQLDAQDRSTIYHLWPTLYRSGQNKLRFLIRSAFINATTRSTDSIFFAHPTATSSSPRLEMDLLQKNILKHLVELVALLGLTTTLLCTICTKLCAICKRKHHRDDRSRWSNHVIFVLGNRLRVFLWFMSILILLFREIDELCKMIIR